MINLFLVHTADHYGTRLTRRDTSNNHQVSPKEKECRFASTSGQLEVAQYKQILSCGMIFLKLPTDKDDQHLFFELLRNGSDCLVYQKYSEEEYTFVAGKFMPHWQTEPTTKIKPEPIVYHEYNNRRIAALQTPNFSQKIYLEISQFANLTFFKEIERNEYNKLERECLKNNPQDHSEVLRRVIEGDRMRSKSATPYRDQDKIASHENQYSQNIVSRDVVYMRPKSSCASRTQAAQNTFNVNDRVTVAGKNYTYRVVSQVGDQVTVRAPGIDNIAPFKVPASDVTLNLQKICQPY